MKLPNGPSGGSPKYLSLLTHHREDQHPKTVTEPTLPAGEEPAQEPIAPMTYHLGAMPNWLNSLPIRERPRQATSKEPFCPPDTWNAHRAIRLDSCKCSLDVISMDPLMAAASHNLTCSRLCQLPEVILIRIMEHLDPLGMQCIRRACRLFLRLYCDPAFAYSHDVERFWRDSFLFQHWLSPDESYWPRESGPALVACLERDTQDLCDICRSVRMKPDWSTKVKKLATESLYCDGCGKQHPIALFSPDQRAKSKDRICIGREGHVRLCDHKVVAWEKVAISAKQLANIHYTHQARIELSRCDHPDHRPKHHGASMVEQCHDTSPSVSIEGARGHSIFLFLKWEGHLLINGDLPMKPALLCQQLKPFRKGLAEFIAPKISPGRFPEMNCFDLNRCDCLFYEGMERLPEWPRPSLEELKTKSCRVHPEDYRLRALRKPTDNCESRIDGHCTILQGVGRPNLGTSEVGISIVPCVSGNERCLAIYYARTIELTYSKEEWQHWPDHVTVAWCQALEPESYGLTEDVKALGVNWCPTPGCKNYYKYLRKVVAPLDEIKWP